MNPPLLTVEDLVAGYGSANVLDGVSLQAAGGAITCLLGANGVGKSTLIKAIFGLRVSAKEEMMGLDLSEHKSEAYSGFQIFSNM